jgi:tRNA modification GTPase
VSGSDDHPRTRICILTAPGRSAIAVVAVAGSAGVDLVQSHFQAVNGRPLAEQQIARIVYGHWGGDLGEDLVVYRRNGQELEIHCHGGTQSVARVVNDLVGTGCEQIDWPDWIAQRTNCPLLAEAQVAVAAATTLRTATILLDQYHGALRRELEATRELLGMGNLTGATRQVEQLLNRAEFGRHLTQPWRVVIAGLPNVGKSSLINALVGYERAIVFDQPGTTRDVVSTDTALDGWPVQLSDTAGLHATTDVVEASGVALAREQLQQADLVVWLLDGSTLGIPTVNVARELVTQQSAAVSATWPPERTLIAVNKCDQAQLPAESNSELLLLSATTGAGLPQLIDTMAQRLVPQAPPVGSGVPFTERQIDLLRELLGQLQAEQVGSAADGIEQLLSNAR